MCPRPRILHREYLVRVGASAQEIIYVPLAVTPLKSVTGLHPEDANIYKQAQRAADYARTGAGVTHNDRDILYLQYAQHVADADYVGAELIPIAEDLKAKLVAHTYDTHAVEEWASKLTEFATAVIQADIDRINVAEAVPFSDCDKIPKRTVEAVNACIIDTRAMKLSADQKATDNRRALDTLIGGDINLVTIRQLMR
jgi:hypothetical protein